MILEEIIPRFVLEPRLQPTYLYKLRQENEGYLSSALFLAESYPSCIRSLAGTKVLRPMRRKTP
jgi:hypothetical protein